MSGDRLYRARVVAAILLAAYGILPSGSAAADDGGLAGVEKKCSTCSSADGISHQMANDCCGSGPFCMLVSSYGEHSEPGWCGDIHAGCDEM